MPPEARNPYLGPLIYLVNGSGDRLLTIREWNGLRPAPAAVPAPWAAQPARCPRCGDTAVLGSFRVCVPCTAACGWDPPCDACRAEDRGGVEFALEHIDTCDPGRRMLRYIAEAERGYDPARLRPQPGSRPRIGGFGGA